MIAFTLRSSLLWPNANDPTGTLQRYFGFDKFRAGQREVIEAVLDGKDAAVF